jgi:hypothetical protein
LHRWPAWGEIVWNQLAGFDQIGVDPHDKHCAKCTKMAQKATFCGLLRL